MQDVIEMARYLNQPGQQDGESERDFRLRIAGVLQDRGQLIAAQEIRAGRRYDDPDNPAIGDPDNPITGVVGHLAAAMKGIDYGGSGERRVEDDAVVGMLATAEPDPAKEAIAKAFDLLGPDGAMKFLGG